MRHCGNLLCAERNDSSSAELCSFLCLSRLRASYVCMLFIDLGLGVINLSRPRSFHLSQVAHSSTARMEEWKRRNPLFVYLVGSGYRRNCHQMEWGRRARGGMYTRTCVCVCITIDYLANQKKKKMKNVKAKKKERKRTHNPRLLLTHPFECAGISGLWLRLARNPQTGAAVQQSYSELPHTRPFVVSAPSGIGDNSVALLFLSRCRRRHHLP